MKTDSIQDARENIAKLQSALDDDRQILLAAERAEEAAQRAHEAVEKHPAMLRTVSVIAIGLIVAAVLVPSAHILSGSRAQLRSAPSVTNRGRPERFRVEAHRVVAT